MMGQTTVLLALAALASPSSASTFFSRNSKVYGVCDPEEDVCHGCEQICSQYADDDKVMLSTKCLAECQTDCYNCMEGTLPKQELEGEEAACIKEKLLERIKLDGDLVIKIVYDVPPGFKEFDQLHAEDGQIDQRDMQVAFDLLDGGAAPDGTVIPTSKVQVVWEVFREADQDGNGIITPAEFQTYDAGKETMGDDYEAGHPTPGNKELADVAEDVALLEVAAMPKKLSTNHGKKSSPHTQHASGKRAKKLAYFQHLLRLGLRVWRAEEHQEHPITKLAHRIGNYMIKHPKPEEK